MGRGSLYGTLGNGGTAYFAAKSDLSTFLDDLALVRPTRLDFVPRIWDMVYQELQSELERRSSSGADRAALEATVLAEQRQNLLGGRFVSALTGSAPISAESNTWLSRLRFKARLGLVLGRDRRGAVSAERTVHRAGSAAVGHHRSSRAGRSAPLDDRRSSSLWNSWYSMSQIRGTKSNRVGRTSARSSKKVERSLLAAK